MPELPEFQTIRCGLAPLPTVQRVVAVEDRELRYADARQFGLRGLIRSNTLAEDPRLRRLGVERLEEAMTDEWNYPATRGRRKAESRQTDGPSPG